MTGAVASPGGRERGVQLWAVLSALPVVGLAFLSPHGWWVGLPVAGVGLMVTLTLTHPKLTALRKWVPTPMIAAAGVAALLASPTPAAELLAGSAALLLLVLVAQATEDPYPLAESMPSLGLPTLALSVAIGSTIALPTIPNQVGAAAALLVVVFLLLAWLFSRTERASSSAPPAS